MKKSFFSATRCPHILPFRNCRQALTFSCIGCAQNFIINHLVYHIFFFAARACITQSTPTNSLQCW